MGGAVLEAVSSCSVEFQMSKLINSDCSQRQLVRSCAHLTSSKGEERWPLNIAFPPSAFFTSASSLFGVLLTVGFKFIFCISLNLPCPFIPLPWEIGLLQRCRSVSLSFRSVLSVWSGPGGVCESVKADGSAFEWEKHTGIWLSQFRCCFQPCLNTNVKGDSVYAITMFRIKIWIRATPPLFVVWLVLTTVVNWKTKWKTKKTF